MLLATKISTVQVGSYGTWYTSFAKRSNDVNTEEWDPAEKKDSHDDTNSDGRFMIGHVIWGRVHMCMYPGTDGLRPVIR